MPEVISSNVLDSMKKYYTDAGWSSLVARRAHNPKVVGSNPAPATNRYCTSGIT
ncbi:hypothetical protein SPRA44_600054 [Serratia proteamaculans]|nr:hypothetical protein SPRA44_600054 [Serratia proteamaculans]